MTECSDFIIVSTGVANLASVKAFARRLGYIPKVSEDLREVLCAPFVILPGVGAFGPAMEELTRKGLDRALESRIRQGLPTAGICLGMQLFFAQSEESPGISGLGIFPETVKRLSGMLPLPQLGWNMIVPGDGTEILEQGWAYFANSYGVSATFGNNLGNDRGNQEKKIQGLARLHRPLAQEQEDPSLHKDSKIELVQTEYFDTVSIATTTYNEPFIAALEAWKNGAPALLLCQFHPELSGPFGAALFSRWIALNTQRRKDAV